LGDCHRWEEGREREEAKTERGHREGDVWKDDTLMFRSGKAMLK
jgi:hypothetical protein